MANDLLFGWDLTFKTVQRDIKQKSDVLVAFLHWNLVKRGFRVIDTGEERTLNGTEEGSEVLPTGWNDKNDYTLRYLLNNKLYILHGLNTDGHLLVNLLRPDDLALSNIVLTVEDVVKEMNGPINVMIPTHKDIIFNIKRDLVDTITERNTSTTETQTVREPIERRPSDDPLRIPPRPIPRPDSPTMPNLWSGPDADPLRVGRSDLDPFARGGGMLFQPFAPGRRDPENPGLGIPGGLPRGAVPPGARFDPFGPAGPGPMPNRRPPPDADHLPPPGFEDMFS